MLNSDGICHQSFQSYSISSCSLDAELQGLESWVQHEEYGYAVPIMVYNQNYELLEVVEEDPVLGKQFKFLSV